MWRAFSVACLLVAHRSCGAELFVKRSGLVVARSTARAVVRRPRDAGARPRGARRVIPRRVSGVSRPPRRRTLRPEHPLQLRLRASVSPRTNLREETHAHLHAGVPGDVDLRLRWRIEMAGLVGNDTDVRWATSASAIVADSTSSSSTRPDGTSTPTPRIRVRIPRPPRRRHRLHPPRHRPPHPRSIRRPRHRVPRRTPDGPSPNATPPASREPATRRRETQLRASLDVHHRRRRPRTGTRTGRKLKHGTGNGTETRRRPPRPRPRLRPRRLTAGGHPGTVSTSRAARSATARAATRAGRDVRRVSACCAIAGPWVPRARARVTTSRRLSGEDPTLSNPGTIVGA